jgi:NADPH:quinone reductase-like Zn-dependent oxidoreductase
METTKMNAAVLSGYGGPEKFELKQVDRPMPKANEVLVKVTASTASRAESMLRSGTPYFARLFTGLTKPKKPILGTGFSGVVDSVGSRVKAFKIGDRVFGETLFNFSTNAEYLTIGEDELILPLPDVIDPVEAATFCDGHLTSMNFLYKIANVQPGEKVLINGAAGSLGTAAVQIAKALGAEVTGVCSTRNIGFVKSLGADYVIDYSKTDFTKNTGVYDVIFDTVGLAKFKKARKTLSDNGRFVTPVFHVSEICNMIFSGKQMKFAATGMEKVPQLKVLLKQVVELVKAGQLKTIIDRQFPLSKIADAHRLIDTGHKKGNLVIINQVN